MRTTELNKYKKRLLAHREQLAGTLTAMQAEALKPAGGGKDVDELADMGSEQFEQDTTLGLIENEQEVIEGIDAALDRIEDGSYGKCPDCEVKIPKARLEALPMARCCVECQSKKEAFGI